MLKTRPCLVLTFTCLMFPCLLLAQIQDIKLTKASLELGLAVLRDVEKDTSAVVVASSIFDGMAMLLEGARCMTMVQLLSHVFGEQMPSTIRNHVLNQRYTIGNYSETKMNYVDIVTYKEAQKLRIVMKGASNGKVIENKALGNNTAEEAQKLNALVSRYTNGIITDAFKPKPQDVPLLLTNAVHFKALWQHPLDNYLKPRPFFVESDKCKVNGENPRVTMMTSMAPLPVQYAEFPYLFNATGVRLPFGDSDNETSFFALLPPGTRDKGSITVDEMLSALDGDVWMSIFRELTQEKSAEWSEWDKVNVVMPAFSVNTSVSLKETLQRRGVRDMFTDKADFSNFNTQKQMFVRNITHKAFLKINKHGAEGTGITEVELIYLMGIPNHMNLIRPFVYVIANTRSGDVYFVGRFMGPNC